MKPPQKIMGSNGPTYSWPAEKLWARVEHYRAMRAVGDRRISRDGEVILWLADQMDEQGIPDFHPERGDDASR